MQPDIANIDTDIVHLPNEDGIEVAVLRLDKIHPVISGNKWFKLQYYLRDAKKLDKKKIVTFGGAWSNHIVATAAACQVNGLESIGIIRGEEPPKLSATLVGAKEFGMELRFISREDYRNKKIPGELINEDAYIINEGGYGKLGALGASAIIQFAKQDFTHCCCAVGTGTMMAGLINAVKPLQQVIGISVLKNNFELEDNVRTLVDQPCAKWQIVHDYHFGGYAKYQPALIRFMNDLYAQTGIPTDFVYNGKLVAAVSDLIKNKFFPPRSKLLLIHSGGLQGNKSLAKGTLIY